MDEIVENDKDSLLVKLKDLHMTEQNELVRDLKVMTQESKKIIDDIVVIEDEIDNYQGQIEGWLKNISELEKLVSKVKASEPLFKRKSENMSKLREFLVMDKGKRR